MAGLRAAVLVQSHWRRFHVHRDLTDLEQSLAAVADKANLELEMRTRELERTKEQRRAECDEEERRAREEEGAASGDLLERHRQIMDAIEEEISNMKNEIHTMLDKKVDMSQDVITNLKNEMNAVLDTKVHMKDIIELMNEINAELDTKLSDVRNALMTHDSSFKDASLTL